MKVKARITAIKRNTEAIVTRESTERVHVDIDNGHHTVEVITRADGRTSIEVKAGRMVLQRLDVGADGTRLLGSIVDGAADLL